MMKHLLRVLLATGFLTLLAVGAHAQDGDSLVVNVPFDFVAANRTMPAGNYTLDRVWFDDPGSLLLRGQNGDAVLLTAPIVGQSKQDSRFVFNRNGGQYFLQEIRTNAGVHQLSAPSAKRIADMSKPETASASGSR